MYAAQEWLIPGDVALPQNEVHIWRASFDLDAEALQALQANLAADEKQRAGRFYFEKDRHQFTAARGILRDILARYLHAAPKSVSLVYGPSGKPTLAASSGSPRLHFNLSHSGGLAIYGVSAIGEIGVDVERLEPRVTEERVAERFFAPAEVAALRALPDALQTQGFFNCWTRKEAYVKARGGGLSIQLSSFCVSLVPGAPAEFLQGAEGWSLYSFSPQAGYVGAVAAPARDLKFRQYVWCARK